MPFRPAAEPCPALHRDAGTPEPWVWSQRWSDLLFLHWRVRAGSIRPLLPPGVGVEEREGTAWVSLLLFRLKVRPRWLPFVPGLSTLTEANLRTYVRAGGKSGIYFLNIFADNRLSVRLARLLTPLPYRFAQMSYRRTGDGFRFEREEELSRNGLSLEFRPAVCRRVPADDSLDAWLLERYRAFAWGGRAGLMAAEVVHPPWLVADVESLRAIPAGESWWSGLPPGSPDAIHYSEGMGARFGAFRAVDRAE